MLDTRHCSLIERLADKDGKVDEILGTVEKYFDKVEAVVKDKRKIAASMVKTEFDEWEKEVKQEALIAKEGSNQL